METIKKLPLTCPSCESDLTIRQLHCGKCGTEITGDYKLPDFLKLSAKEQDFIVEFVKTSGSLKEMARQMGISYPTIRNFLDDLIVKLKNMEGK